MQRRVSTLRSTTPTLSSRPEQIIAKAMICGVEGPCVWFSARETEIKKWRREKKVALIESVNPLWNDLAADWASLSGRAQQIPRAIKLRFGMTKG